MSATPYFKLNPEDFPLVIEAYHPVTKKIVWTELVPEPETAVHIPALAEQIGHPVVIRFILATGQIVES